MTTTHPFEKLARFICAAACFATAVIFLAACREPETVKPLKRPEDMQRNRDDREDRGDVRRRTPRPFRDRGVAASTSQSTDPMDFIPTPNPAYIRGYKHEPITISALDMAHDNGDIDNGGWKLGANGAISTAPLNIPFMTKRITLEMRGEPAHNIWPEVDLNMYNRTLKMNYYPFLRTYVTTSTYHMYNVDINPQLTPGEYQITFRYYNNQVPPGSKEDRNVSLKTLTFHPFLVQ